MSVQICGINPYSQKNLSKNSSRPLSYVKLPAVQNDTFVSSRSKTQDVSFSGLSSFFKIFASKKQEIPQEEEFDFPVDSSEKEYFEDIKEKLKNPVLPYAYDDVPTSMFVKKSFFGDEEIISGSMFKCDKLDKITKYEHRYIPEEGAEEKSTIDTKKLAEIFHKKKSLNYSVPVSSKGNYNPIKSEDAFLSDEKKQTLGTTANTDLTIQYGSKVSWKNEKIARDLMQNFYDGHNKTVEGTTLKIDYDRQKKKYNVRLEGQGLYPSDFIQYIGMGTKFDDRSAAGGFGEGSKILACNLLSKQNEDGKFRTDSVKYASADWEMSLTRSSDDIKTAIMQRTLNQTDGINGNYVEFDTDDENLVAFIIKSLDWFESPYNKDFQNLDFENDYFALNVLPQNQKGNLYLTQRFEYNNAGNWDNNINGASIIFKQKPSDEDFSINRDRSYLSDYDIELIMKSLVKNFKDEEIVDLIKKTDFVWMDYKRDDALTRVVDILSREAGKRNIGIDFGDNKFVSISRYSDYGDVKLLENLGYTPVNASVMPLVATKDEVLMKKGTHLPIKPTEKETQKMLLLKEGVKLIQSATQRQIEDDITDEFYQDTDRFDKLSSDTDEKELKKNDILSEFIKSRTDISYPLLLSKEDCDRPVFVYDASKENQKDDIVGQAIVGYDSQTQSRYYKGHWIEKKYLDYGNFYRVLATYIHEMTHQYGEDGSMEFTYALTDQIGEVLSIMSARPDIAKKLNILSNFFMRLEGE